MLLKFIYKSFISSNYKFIMKNRLWLALSFIGCFLSCANPEFDGFIVSGKVDKGAGKMLYFEKLKTSEVVLRDSIILSQTGEFEFKDTTSEISFYRLRISNNNFLTIIINSKDRISVSSSIENLLYSAINGSEESLLLQNLNQQIKQYSNQVDSLQIIYRESFDNKQPDSFRKVLEEEYFKTLSKQEKGIKTFIDTNINNFVVLYAITQLNSEQESDYYIKVADALFKEFPASSYIQDFYNRIAPLRKSAHLAIGKEVPEISLNNPEGVPVALSSLRGKIVLIDFWASWCRPCRMENPNVVRVYETYRNKGFEIFGVSLDNDKAKWIQAIKDDKIKWIQVSQLNAWNSEVVKLFNIQGIPFTILIDKEGKIIAKGLRGKELEVKLEQIFADNPTKKS